VFAVARRHYAADGKTVERLVGSGVRRAHVAAPDNQYS
jgi:hypothetical protein